MSRFTLISKRKINISEENGGKPLAVIFNPYCSDRLEEIQGMLDQRKVMYEIIVCEENLDPYRKALGLEIDNYSALIAIGGDGTFNQMVNGMIAREDKKKLPVGLIPTGQSNDVARSLGFSSEMLITAIDNIAKGEAIPVDTTRVILDNDSEATLPKGEERLTKWRHMISNASLSMPAKIANNANSWKGMLGGGSAFSLSTYT